MDKTQKIISIIGITALIIMAGVAVLMDYKDSQNQALPVEVSEAAPNLPKKIPENEVYKTYHENGNLESELLFQDYALNGKSRFYDENGVLNSEIYYVNGKAEGEAFGYYPDGSVMQVADMKSGKFHGKGAYYYEDGTIQAKEKYENGVLLSRVRFKEDGSEFMEYLHEEGDTATDILIFNYKQLLNFLEKYVEWTEKKAAEEEPGENEEELLGVVLRFEEIVYLIENAVITKDKGLLEAKELLKVYTSKIGNLISASWDEESTDEDLLRLEEEVNSIEVEFREIISVYYAASGLSINPFISIPKGYDYSKLDLYGWSVLGTKISLIGCVYLGIPALIFFLYLSVVGSIIGRKFNNKFKNFVAGKISADQITSPWLQFLYGVHLIALLPFLYFVLILCVPLALMLGALPVYISYKIGYISYWLVFAFACVAGLSMFSVLMGVFGHKKRYEFGYELKDSAEPRLRSIITEVGKTLNAKPIDRLIITPDSGIGVYLTGGVFDLIVGRTKSTVSVGLGALSGMTVSEFKAILAHEYGHFSNNDTSWNSLTFTNAGLLENTIRNMPTPDNSSGGAFAAAAGLNPALWALILYQILFSIFTNGFSRIGEVLADKNAVKHYGRKNFANGLQRVSLNSLLFAELANPGDIAKKIINEGKVFTNLYTYLDAVKENLSEEQKKNLEEQLVGEEVSLHDSHPPYRDRISYTAHFEETGVNQSDESMISEIFDDWESWAKLMSQTYNERIMALLEASGHKVDPQSNDQPNSEPEVVGPPKVCRGCNQENNPSFTHCWKCGKAL